MNNKSTKTFYLFYCCIFIACQNREPAAPPPEFQSFPVKLASEIGVDDFRPASECQECHPQHHEEWSHSMHAFAMKDPVFLQGWENEQRIEPEKGERFCIQCHSPVAFVTGTYLNEIYSAEEMEELGVPEVIREGIGCDFCHSVTRPSKIVETPDNLEAVAEYNLYPGEGIKFGPIEPDSAMKSLLSFYGSPHEVENNSLFKSSQVCLPCHDMSVRGVGAEKTFTEWELATEFSMGNIHSCQECHMPLTTRKVVNNDEAPVRIVHRHTFVGVDLDLSKPAEDSPQFEDVTDLLEGAVTLEFDTLTDSINIGDVLTIPVVVTSKTGHSLPSGASFAREAWLEIVVNINDYILFESGLLPSNSTPLDSTDTDLLLFTTYLIGDTLTGKITSSVSQAHGIIDQSLKASEKKTHSYEFQLSADQIPENSNGIIAIQLRMLFRPFKPKLLLKHPVQLANLPIFEMSSILDTIYIKSN